MQAHSGKRVFGLDLMRAIAILLVVFSNLSWITPKAQGLIPDMMGIAGVLGVELFFVLSGFLIGRIIYKLYISDDFSFNVKDEYEKVTKAGQKSKMVLEKSLMQHAKICAENSEDVFDAHILSRELNDDIEFRIKQYSYCIYPNKSGTSFYFCFPLPQQLFHHSLRSGSEIHPG